MSANLVILGATAYPEIAELIRDINDTGSRYSVRCILDDNNDLHHKRIEGVEVIGGIDLAREHRDACFVMGIGSHKSRLIRRQIVDRLNISDDRWATLIHPRAKVYASASIGSGSIVHCGAVVGNGARLGRWVIVLWNSVLGANTIIGDGAMCASNVTVNSRVKIGSYSFVGAASAIADSICLEPGAMIGMGSLIIRDVPLGAFQFGFPSRILSRDDVPREIVDDWQTFKAESC